MMNQTQQKNKEKTLETFLQWNPNSVLSKQTELSILITKLNPIAIAIQETRLKPSSKFDLKHYTTYRRDFLDGGNASDGVAILTNSKYYSEEIIINSNLQAIAVRMKTKNIGLTTLCSLYLPPHETIVITDLTNLVNQLPKPYLIMSDANAHSQLWGGQFY